MIRQQTFRKSKNRGQVFIATHGRGLFTSESYLTSNSKLKEPNLKFQSFNLFPNPAQNIIRFDLTIKPFTDIIIQVTDMQGRTVLFKKQKDNQLDITELNSGSYSIFIQNGENFYSSKFIKR
jgi:hypothetical protein